MAEILLQVPWNSMDGRSPFSSLNPSHFSANVLPQTIRVEHPDSNARLFPCARIMPHPGPAAKRFLSPRGITAATPSRVSCGMIPGWALFLRRVARVLALQPGSLIRCCFHHPWERHCCVSSEWYGTILPNGALSSPELRPCERLLPNRVSLRSSTTTNSRPQVLLTSSALVSIVTCIRQQSRSV